jgi:cell division protein ZapE
MAASNLAPDRLYEHGLQHELFLPFIALLKEKLYVVELDSGHNWRLARLVGRPVYATRSARLRTRRSKAPLPS